jgi:hypothetical protein
MLAPKKVEVSEQFSILHNFLLSRMHIMCVYIHIYIHTQSVGIVRMRTQAMEFSFYIYI